ncbi:cardiolipin synthase [Schinkia azotoformans]|uniref:cardiolipin synthase n=1 Tax=Schinkia azotoformans TaxID=1454 RepID=UPI002DB730A1|nr:cardiolipin synthase [Schinkia azotoformans]MEC1719248.1 cardiolipin synthase [Schinkia azotoformans]MED4353317.1 cardiolipin synthase [Schinkia azotoformans]MED4413454.1 cardiolipin synthase [Schinkia azotoformans]
MKKRLQIAIFIIGLTIALVLTHNYWEGWLLGSFSILISISALFIGFFIFLENRNPRATIAWAVVLAVFPIFGFIFYLLFGRNYRRERKRYEKKAWLDEQAFSKIEGNRQINEEELNKMGEHQQKLFRLAHRLGKSPISFYTETKVLTNGNDTFKAILEAMRSANHHIHLEFYIVRDDELGNEIKDILIEKAKSGVAVRFLYDAVGSWKLSKNYINELRNSGVEIEPFSPVRLPSLNNQINFRNHRKICVVDGNIGFVGGLNIGDEYLGKNEYFGFWRDTHLYVRGEAVRSLQLIFLQDWYYTTGVTLLTPIYLSPNLVEDEEFGGVHLLAGGPDNDWNVIKNVFFAMITSAKKSIWIESPYFIPDDDILSALRVAALSGIDVKVILPSKPDKRLVFYASRSYYTELLEAGIKVYEYSNGFLHSKIIIVDQELASIGTSNMDMRSFHLNFEVNAFLYRTKSAEALVNDFLNDIENSNEVLLAKYKERPKLQRLHESTARLFSPLL